MNYLGYRDGDADTAYGRFFNPRMAPLPPHIVTALEHGPQAAPVLCDFDSATKLLDAGYQQTENGYWILRDGGTQVSVRTDMPGVSPSMWTWWFGWHGSDARRYKLWHPRAHVSARWSDGDGDGRYLRRTSLVHEYLGSRYTRAAIHFVEPSTLGLRSAVGEVAICAAWGRRICPSTSVGWFITSARPWTGRRCGRGSGWVVDMSWYAGAIGWPTGLFGRSRHGSCPDPRDLMVHCAQEMNHLAGFLAELYATVGDT